MKNNFKRNFINEFNNTNDNSEQKETLKGKLDLVPSIDDELHFKKKQFYRLSTLVAVLLVLITSAVTFAITSYANFDKQQNITQDEELEYFKELYGADDIKLVTRSALRNNDFITIIRFYNSIDKKVVISLINMSCKYKLKVCIDGNEKEQIITSEKEFYEYNLENCKENDLSIYIEYKNEVIFEFCTKI